MRLANGIVAFEFDPHTGSLIQIQDLRSGVTYLSDPGEGRLYSACLSPMTKTGSTVMPTATSRDLHRWSFRVIAYRYVIRSSTLPMAARSGSRPSPASAFHRATTRLFSPSSSINHGPHLIWEVLFPWVGGWHGYPADRGVIQCGARAPFDPFTDLRRDDGWNLLNGTRRVSLGFPHVNLPLCAVHNNHLGLSYNFYPLVRDLNFDLFVMDLNEASGAPHPGFAWVQRPFLPGGGAWQEVEWIWVKGHNGHDENERADALARAAIPGR